MTSIVNDTSFALFNLALTCSTWYKPFRGEMNGILENLVTVFYKECFTKALTMAAFILLYVHLFSN